MKVQQYTALYLHVLPCTCISRGTGLSGTALYRHVQPCIEKRTRQYEKTPELQNMLVCTSIYVFILVSTDSYQSYASTYQYRPMHTSSYQHISICKYIPVQTSTYQLIQAHSNTYLYVLACTDLYQYIPEISGFKKVANKVQTRDLLHTFCILYRCTASAQRTNTGYLSSELFVYITILLAPAPLRPRLQP